MSDLIELRPMALNGNLPIALNTAYCWNSRKRYPKLIVKVAGKLFWNCAEWDRMGEEAMENQIKEAKRINAF